MDRCALLLGAPPVDVELCDGAATQRKRSIMKMKTTPRADLNRSNLSVHAPPEFPRVAELDFLSYRLLGASSASWYPGTTTSETKVLTTSNSYKSSASSM
ncbi:hypothetical protein ONZ45_g12175 [Pleurotus djamor]|nr:hypothetical protein ONZ45_g12175 [Pleurotus djamor]